MRLEERRELLFKFEFAPLTTKLQPSALQIWVHSLRSWQFVEPGLFAALTPTLFGFGTIRFANEKFLGHKTTFTGMLSSQSWICKL